VAVSTIPTLLPPLPAGAGTVPAYIDPVEKSANLKPFRYAANARSDACKREFGFQVQWCGQMHGHPE